VTRVWLVVRSVAVWTIGLVHFAVGCSLFAIGTFFIDPVRYDGAMRAFSRNIFRLAGVGFRVERAAGFDATRTSLFVANHIDLLDAFIIYASVPQLVRGIELESHFRIPFYGWLMKALGNVGVPPFDSAQDRPFDSARGRPFDSAQDRGGDRDSYRRLVADTKRSLDRGISLAVFPEGTRTRTGLVGPFHVGFFRLAIRLGCPIVPVSIVGAYEFSRKGSWLMRPSTIVVQLHDTIETRGLTRADAEALMARTRRIVSDPVDQSRQRVPLPA
jgi:1-acyl-sn-glycerol-3-phosphate acyltransferase